jgi:uncharacterized protein (TIGR03435 family)
MTCRIKGNRITLAWVSLMVASGVALAQSPAPARLSFEVATIKLTDPDRTQSSINIADGTFRAIRFTLNDLMAYAYTMHHDQILEGPPWTDTERFDIVGKPEKEPLVIDDAKLMVQSLLAERFGLTFHQSTKDLRVYVLSIANGGSKLKIATDLSNKNIAGCCNSGKISARAALLSTLWFFFESRGVLDRPVLDQTGLTDRYEFALEWSTNPGPSTGAQQNNPDAPDVFTALREQFGLKLEAKRAPAPVLVIDNIHRPSEN